MLLYNWRSSKSLTFAKITRLVYIYIFNEKPNNKSSVSHPLMFPILVKVLLKDARDINFNL